MSAYPKISRAAKLIFEHPFVYLGVSLFILFLIAGFSFSKKTSPSKNDLLASLSSQINQQSLYLAQDKMNHYESPDLSLVQKNSLKPTAPPAALSSKTLATLIEGPISSQKREIVEYQVKNGDCLGKIAKQFDISLNTLLWANNLSLTSKIYPGQKLLILPVSGVMYMVREGDTLKKIAKKYKGDVDEIIALNELAKDGTIYVRDILIIPGGEMPSVKKVRSSYTKIPLSKSYLLCPVSLPAIITQGTHYYHAIDFSHKGISCGNPVWAAAEGTVQKVSYGYNNGYGNYVQILHPNGVVTLYGHLQSILVKPSQKVSQGKMIGLIGHTGHTIPSGPHGCHLHFEVRGATNPFSIYRKNTILNH